MNAQSQELLTLRSPEFTVVANNICVSQILREKDWHREAGTYNRGGSRKLQVPAVHTRFTEPSLLQLLSSNSLR